MLRQWQCDYCDHCVQASTHVTLEDALLEIANVDLVSSDSFSTPAKRKVGTTAILFSQILVTDLNH